VTEGWGGTDARKRCFKERVADVIECGDEVEESCVAIVAVTGFGVFCPGSFV
jgi:hypothetical protein